jgi:predicted nucleotidyltransferase component of viral defense system
MNTKNVGASVYAKLKNVAKERGMDMHVILRRYAQERLLYRLSVSPVAKEFCVKGGLLLTAYNNGNLLRPTEDVDFNGFRKGATLEDLRRSVVCIVETVVEPDGVDFIVESMTMKKEHTGIIGGGKISLQAKIHTAKVEVRIDVGFGNSISPEVRMLEMPTILSSVAPRPVIFAYPMETVIAEKLHAMVEFGMYNTRIKDHFDIWTLINMHQFDADAVSAAIKATFENQNREIPIEPLACLSEEYALDKQASWGLFLKKIEEKSKPDFIEVVSDLDRFTRPLMLAAALNEDFHAQWTPQDGWVSPNLASTFAIRAG